MPVTYSSADAIADIPAADYITLRDRFLATAKVQDTLAGERNAIAKEMKAREDVAVAKLRLGTLNEADRAMYRAILEARQA